MYMYMIENVLIRLSLVFIKYSPIQKILLCIFQAESTLQYVHEST